MLPSKGLTNSTSSPSTAATEARWVHGLRRMSGTKGKPHPFLHLKSNVWDNDGKYYSISRVVHHRAPLSDDLSLSRATTRRRFALLFSFYLYLFIMKRKVDDEPTNKPSRIASFQHQNPPFLLIKRDEFGLCPPPSCCLAYKKN